MGVVNIVARTEKHEQGYARPLEREERAQRNGEPRYPRRMRQLRVDLVVGDLIGEVGRGDHVILHRGDAGAREALRATVIESENGKISVSISAPLARSPAECDVPVMPGTEEASDRWFVDLIPFSRGPEVARKALLDFFLRADPEIVRLVVRGGSESPADESVQTSLQSEGRVRGSDRTEAEHAESTPSGEPGGKRDARARNIAVRSKLEDLCFGEGLTCELNEDQEDAIQAALSSEPFHLIHGPPGTGKTRVLARLIRIWLDHGERVLVACPTNIALDRLLLALIDLGVRDFIRVGSRSRLSREFQDALEKLGSPPRLLSDLASTNINVADFRKRVGEVQLVGATAYQCAAHPIFLRQRFDRVAVDEAGQLDEPSTLGVLALAPRFVLGGDHFQLPPVVQALAPGPEGDRGLEQSLFERLFDSCAPSKISRLKIQYRMNREIQEIPSRLFYEGTLVPSPEAASRRLSIDPGQLDDVALGRIIDPAVPAVFVDVEGSNTGKARPEEAAVASRILETLLACGVPATEIGIITPYRVQQALIREHLLNRRQVLPPTSINTVDRFQGGEREVIILSLARSDGVTSFLADRRRLNVSLSRARSKLILLGHGPILMEHPLFASLLEGLQRVAIDPGA
ncbi:MAG: AAA domain-containing protein [Deltaproteobacteria bacterium]